MLFLTEHEKKRWRAWGKDAMMDRIKPKEFKGDVRPNLKSVFNYYAGALLAAEGREDRAKEWFVSGVMDEEQGLFSNAFVSNFLERQNGRFIMPETCFADPRPWVHFSTIPSIKQARRNFLTHCGHSLPEFKHPIRIMDIGCGDGALAVMLLKHLIEIGKVGEVAEILLVDSSASMIELAKKTVSADFPASIIKTANNRIEAITDKMDEKYDVALSSLAFHHMPRETKIVHLERLRSRIDHFLLFELDANNDAPELYSPELALSLYQSYGRAIDMVFAHDAPAEVAIACVDRFWMVELVSFLTQPRGVRTDYHMLRPEWCEVFEKGLGPEFARLCDSTCYADEYMGLFTMHYGR